MLRILLILVLIFLLSPVSAAPAQTIWIEGESADTNTMHPHGWYDSVNKDQLSGGNYISNFSQQEGTATYKLQIPEDGEYDFWIRANHVATRIQYQWDNQAAVDINTSGAQQALNIAADGKPDLRFLAWINVGPLPLKAGQHQLTFRMVSDNNHHGSLDCFVLSRDGFVPNGKTKPGDRPDVTPRDGWFVFYPQPDNFADDSAIDLRYLNQEFAGQDGQVVARDGKFWFSKTDQPVRFWAVNGPPHSLTGKALQRSARRLAKYGVNMVRVHHRTFTADGKPDLKHVAHCHEIVKAMKAEGIYVHFSIYFPLWYQPQPGDPALPGYDGQQNPFAALYFNDAFQKRYQSWLDALLLTPGPEGQRLIDDPAVFGIELINEDSLFFWTFNQERIPASQFQLVETQFAQWLIKKYGSLKDAYQSWGSQPLPGDGKDRMALRPLWNIANQRTPRDQDTATFLAEVQYRFYQKFQRHLKDIEFQGLVTCSNWHTASPEYLDPLERLSYTAGDFVDRHGYFSGQHQGDAASYSIRQDHVYTDRSALRFDSATPGKPKDFTHPAMDLHYNQMPSMISETTFNRPNRYRSEGPLFFAAYGALQDSDAIVHFAYDSDHWAVQTGGINPWTLSTPAMMGQFPAAALLYRQGLVQTPSAAVTIDLNLTDVKALKGTPLPQGASFDQLRAADLPPGEHQSPQGRLDPLLHLVGPTRLQFTDQPTSVQVNAPADAIDHAAQVVQSSNRQLRLDFGKGLLRIDAPAAQGASGSLASSSPIQLSDIQIQSDNDLQHVILVSLDQQPLAQSRRMLLQVMSEESPSGRETVPAQDGAHRITSLGNDPWQVKQFQGKVILPGGQTFQITRLDENGRPAGPPSSGKEVILNPETLYYLIQR